jgi:hypothetical protein
MALGRCPCLPGCLCWPCCRAGRAVGLAVLSGWPCCRAGRAVGLAVLSGWRAGRLPVLSVTRMSVLAGRMAEDYGECRVSWKRWSRTISCSISASWPASNAGGDSLSNSMT